MNQVDSNFMQMAGNSISFLDQNKEFWGNEPEIVNEVNDVKLDYDSLNILYQVLAGSDLKSLTDSINEYYLLIVNKTLAIISKLNIYAIRKGNIALEKQTDIGRKDLTEGMRGESINRCLAFVTKANSYIDDTASFKLTPYDIADFHQCLAEYHQLEIQRSEMQTDRISKQQEATDRMTSLRAHFAMLDKLVHALIDDKQTIARYDTSRIVRNYGKSKTMRKKTTDQTELVEVQKQ